MNISTEIELGLKRLCNPALINDQCFQMLLQKAEKILGTLLSETSEQTLNDGKTKYQILPYKTNLFFSFRKKFGLFFITLSTFIALIF